MLTQFTAVWNEVVSFLISLFPQIEALFYNTETSSLTFIGTLGIIMCGVGLILLIWNLIRSFLIAKA